MKQFLSILSFVAIGLCVTFSPLHAQSVSDAQKQNVKKLVSDLKAIQAESKVTDEMKQDLSEDLLAVYETEKTKPSKSSVKTLAQDLAKALDDSKMSEDELNKLCEDLVMILVSAGISQEQAEKLMEDLQKILKASNVDANDVKTILSDLKTVYKATEKGSTAKISEEQRKNVQKLVEDLKAIQAKSEVTDEMKKDLYEDIMAAAQDAHKPSSTAVQQLSNDLAKMLDDGSLSAQELNKLCEAIILVLMSAGISEEQAEKIMSDVQKILKASNITSDDINKIMNDLKEIQKSIKR